MTRQEKLLKRLDAIGAALEAKGGARALLGLGSVGVETDRLDAFSDLDFFAIVEPGQKERYIERLDWLEAAHPLAYSFRNTPDGHKILFEDGIYGEFAVFEEREMPEIAYARGRIVWSVPDFAPEALDTLARPEKPYPTIRKTSLDYPLNEALTNLYVGLCRCARGEKLSAQRFIENHAVDNILSVLHLLEAEAPGLHADPFSLERRVEVRYPQFAERLDGMLQGRARIAESALAVLAYLESVYPVNAGMAQEIRRLAEVCRG